MSGKKYGGTLSVTSLRNGLKTGLLLTSFCECGKKTIKVRSCGLMSRINGIWETEAIRGIGDDRDE